jgi:hypothetical protein
MAAAVAAPALAAGLVLALSWSLRTVSVRTERLFRWRERRGPRRSDSALAALCTPWFALRALPGAVVNSAIAVVSGAGVVVAATLALPPRTVLQALAVAGLLAAVVCWCGPFSRDVRAGGRVMSSVLLHPRTSALLVVLALAVAGLAVLLTREIAGPVYAPFPPPPWQHVLRGSLP